jgi:hypothetical protein
VAKPLDTGHPKEVPAMAHVIAGKPQQAFAALEFGQG